MLERSHSETAIKSPNFYTSAERFAKRAVGGPILTAFYVSSFLLCIAVFTMEILKAPAFVYVEGALTAVLFIEVVMGIVAFGKKYFQHLMNVLDLVVLCCSLGSFLIVAVGLTPKKALLVEYLDTVLLGIRYALQTIRIIALICKAVKVGQYKSAQMIEFPNTPTLEDEEVKHPQLPPRPSILSNSQ